MSRYLLGKFPEPGPFSCVYLGPCPAWVAGLPSLPAAQAAPKCPPSSGCGLALELLAWALPEHFSEMRATTGANVSRAACAFPAEGWVVAPLG